MYIKGKLTVSGDQVSGTIINSNKKGNTFEISKIIGINVLKVLTIEQIEQLRFELSVISTRMRTTELLSEKYIM